VLDPTVALTGWVVGMLAERNPSRGGIIANKTFIANEKLRDRLDVAGDSLVRVSKTV
jgi:hypothetical protein